MYSNKLNTRNYKKLQLVFLYLSGARDQSWCPKHMGKCLATELYLQSNVEKQQLNQFTAQSFLVTENTATKRLQVIKTSNQLLHLKCTNPNAKSQEI
jgi:hypothetical protein